MEKISKWEHWAGMEERKSLTSAIHKGRGPLSLSRSVSIIDTLMERTRRPSSVQARAAAATRGRHDA